MRKLALLTCILGFLGLAPASAEEPKPLKLLFLGDKGHHRPEERFRQLQPVLAARGIDVTYTEKVESLSPKILAGYDGLIVYANIERITPEQETALLDYVAGGKGFIPLHCASYCFLNSPKYVELVGAQFKSHGTGTFRTTSAGADHPLMKGFRGFESWDETYVHTRHNEKDRTVLEYRVDRSGKEPWTWVRTVGKGRVFYTAWGHDERTWSHPGFQNLVERGIRWAIGADPSVVPAYADTPEMTTLEKDVKPFEYVEANVPFYPPGERGATSGPLKQMQKPLDPAESAKHMVHPVDLEPRLFVDETLLGGKPICMNWDERGRLWVAITQDYPNEMQPAGKGRDRIVICEDTDGDGKADKVTVFADKLSIPTSLTFARGGVIVHQAPQTLFLKDTGGDGKADERKVLFTGWHTNDTHAGPSNLRYGLDNYLYGIVGYAGFDGDINGKRQSFRAGFYRFSADGTKLEFLRNTNNNSWGVGFSEEGLLFGSTANGCPSVYLPIPNRYYESVRGWSSSVLQSIALENRFHPITNKVRQVDWHGGFTAAAGHALYTARTYPPEYWNRTAFVSDPTGHLTATFVLQPSGSDFRARYGWNLLGSDDEWTGPVMAEVGPDGNVWVIDWYSFIVQHNPTPAGFRTGKGGAYETELRDKKHGRIYRLVAKDAKANKPVSLADATPEQLVAALKNDNMFWRLHAQRLLVERGKTDVMPGLLKLIADPATDGIGLNPGAIHALWTLHGLGALDGKNPEATAAAVTALRHKSAGVRRNAVLVLPRTAESVRSILDARILADTDAQVRLAALLALAEMPANADAGAAIVGVLARSENASDRWIPDAATSAAAAHDLHFLTAAATNKELPQRLLDVTAIVAEHHGRRDSASTVNSLVTVLASADTRLAEVVIGGLSRGWPKSRSVQLTPDGERAMTQLLAKFSPAGKGRVLQLASIWGVRSLDKNAEEVAGSLLAIIKDAKQSDSERAAAARQVIEFRPADAKLLGSLLDVVSPRLSPQLSVDMLDAAGKSTAPEAGKAIVERLSSWSPAARAAALRVLVSRAESARVLLDAIDQGNIPLTDLTLDQKQALASHPDRKVAEQAKKILARGGALPSPDRQKVIDELMALTKKTGDTAKGKAMFTKHCSACHRHGSEGNLVGPDLTGMNVHPKHELLVHILDPNRSVEGNYRAYVVALRDGRTLTGLLASETKTSVELVDSQAKRFMLQRDDIEELVATTKSVMPEGFEKQMSGDEFTDLLEFLTARGKYLPLPLGKAATITSVRGMFYGEDSTVERLIFSDWKPKTFEGVPFLLVDPQDGRVPNVVMLYGPQGKSPPKMPKSVSLPCNSAAKAIHLLSGVSGWGFPLGRKGSVSMIVRLHYDDGKTEDHELKNGEHFADYIRRVDVPESKFAFPLRGQQVRYLTVTPKRAAKIERIELVKGSDDTAPVVMAVTVEAP